MVTTGVTEGETERKRKFVARTEGEYQEGEKREREREGTERENERDRMSFRGRLISLSTRLPVSLCPRLFVSLFYSTSCARKLESVTPFAIRPLPSYLHVRPFKIMNFDRYYRDDNGQSYKIFFSRKETKSKRLNR